MVTMNLDQEVLAEFVANRVLTDYDFTQMVRDKVAAKIDKAVNTALNDGILAMVGTAVDKVISEWRDLRVQRTNTWGEPSGAKISIPEFCEEALSAVIKDRHDGSSFSKKATAVVEEEVRNETKAILAKNREQFETMIAQMLAGQLASKLSK